MKKLLSIVCSIMMTLSLCACSTSNNTGTVTEPETVSDYLNKYEVLYSCGSDKGFNFVLDDGSEYGLSLNVTLTAEQRERIDALDFFSETYDADVHTIVAESTTFTTTSLDEYAPDMSTYDQYIGQKLAVLFDEGYYEMGNLIDSFSTIVDLNNGTYDISVTVEEVVALDQDMSEEFERTLTAKSFEFVGFSDDFFYSLFK